MIRRTYLFVFQSVYRCCREFITGYPEIEEIANQLSPGTYARQGVMPNLKKLAPQGNGELIVDWLRHLEGDEFALESQIWTRRTELGQFGIELLMRQQDLCPDLPKVDLLGLEDKKCLAIEVKDHNCGCEAVGQALCYASYLRQSTDKFEVRAAIMARSFALSTCYAASGQPITLFRIDLNAPGLVLDRVEAEKSTQAELNKLAHRAKPPTEHD